MTDGTQRDDVTCPHCGEVSNIGGLVGPNTNDCPKCGEPVLTAYWAWVDGQTLVPLGGCESFDQADERAPAATTWIFDRDSLLDLQQQIAEQIKERAA